MQKLENIRPENRFCIVVMDIDKTIRFAGILCKCGRLKAYRRKKGMIPHLSVPETKLVHREAMLKAKMNHIFDERLGKTNWSIESRDNVKWITIYLNRVLLLLSTERSSNHDVIIQKILTMLKLEEYKAI